MFHASRLTLCTAPQTVVGLISLLNGYQISHDYSSLGFLNPFLYSKGVVGLVGIVVRFSSLESRHWAPCSQDSLCRLQGGTNPGCGTDGFNATVGWDPVSTCPTVSLAQIVMLMPSRGLVAHWFGSVGLWEIAVACVVGESFKRPTMVAGITTYIEPRAITVVWVEGVPFSGSSLSVDVLPYQRNNVGGVSVTAVCITR